MVLSFWAKSNMLGSKVMRNWKRKFRGAQMVSFFFFSFFFSHYSSFLSISIFRANLRLQVCYVLKVSLHAKTR